jgi:co-chaperonin GroES (HSP10)
MGGKYDGHGNRVDRPGDSPTGGTLSPIPMKTYTPTGCLVAVHLFPQSVSTGGIVIPDSVTNGTMLRALAQTARCLVIAVGPDVKELKVGQTVLVFQDPYTIKHKGQTTLVLREDQICGIEDEPTKFDPSEQVHQGQG